MGTIAAIKLGLGVSAFALVIGGGFWFVHHERDVGAQKCEAAVKTATDTELARQGGINENWQQWAAGAVQNADNQKATYDANLRAIATATADDRATCLFSPTADRLRAIGRPGGKANPHASSSGVKR